MRDVQVRPARDDELDAAGELTASAYAEDGSVTDDYLPVLRDARRRATVADLLVAVDAEGRLLGCVTLVPPGAPAEWRETSPDGAATIRMLAVPSAYRRRGVGGALTRACIERARSRGWDLLCLLTGTRMLAAQSLYDAIGFVRDERLDVEVRPGLLLIGYSLALRPNLERDTMARSTVPRATS